MNNSDTDYAPLAHRSLAYFTKVFAPVPHILPLQRLLGGTVYTNRSSTEALISRQFPELPVRSYWSGLPWLSPAFHRLCAADVVVAGSAYPDILRRCRGQSVMIFHGTYMALGKANVDDCRGFDRLCLIGPRMQEMMNRFGGDMLERCEMTGFLPFACFPERTSALRQQLCEQLGLSPEKPIIVYTPTSLNRGSWEFAAHHLIDELGDRYNVVLRPHPTQMAVADASSNRFDALQVAVAARQSARLDWSELPLPSLQAVADLMITDANSPAEESLFYDVPQLFVECPKMGKSALNDLLLEKEVHPSEVDKTLAIFDCGPSWDSQRPDTLCDKVEQALARANEYQPARQRYFNWVFGGRDVNAPHRVASAINRLF